MQGFVHTGAVAASRQRSKIASTVMCGVRRYALAGSMTRPARFFLIVSFDPASGVRTMALRERETRHRVYQQMTIYRMMIVVNVAILLWIRRILLTGSVVYVAHKAVGRSCMFLEAKLDKNSPRV